jgi:hypothetical protein
MPWLYFYVRKSDLKCIQNYLYTGGCRYGDYLPTW